VAKFPAISRKRAKVLDRCRFFAHKATPEARPERPPKEAPHEPCVHAGRSSVTSPDPTSSEQQCLHIKKAESACKPGSVRLAARQSFFSARRHRLAPATNPGTTRAALSFPYSVLLRVGFTVPRGVVPARGALLPHRFTLTCALAGHRRFAFCCTGRQLTLPRRYLAPCPVEPGLSSMRLRATRLSGRLRRP
jgi:hypothetical protein